MADAHCSLLSATGCYLFSSSVLFLQLTLLWRYRGVNIGGGIVLLCGYILPELN